MKRIARILVFFAVFVMMTVLASGIAVSATDLPFTDVQSGTWFYNDTRYLYRNGIMTGVTKTEFKPVATMSRAEFVTVLHRIAGEPKPTLKAEFEDVAPKAWYY